MALPTGPLAPIAGAFTDVGLHRASELLKRAEWMYNHPGEMISNYDTEQQYKNKDIIKIPGKPNNDKPIPGKPIYNQPSPNNPNNAYEASSSNNSVTVTHELNNPARERAFRAQGIDLK